MEESAMETENRTDFIPVYLPPSLAHGLLAIAHLIESGAINSLRSTNEEKQSVSATAEPSMSTPASRLKGASTRPSKTKLSAEILGQIVPGTSLSDLFARCVDVIHELDPIAIERLSVVKTHARRYVARRRENIHFRSPHLQTIKTESGWWVSANVSEAQVTTAMQLLASKAGLTFGKDLIH